MFQGAAAYQLGNTSSRTITEVKQHWAQLVLGWDTVQVLPECLSAAANPFFQCACPKFAAQPSLSNFWLWCHTHHMPWALWLRGQLQEDLGTEKRDSLQATDNGSGENEIGPIHGQVSCLSPIWHGWGQFLLQRQISPISATVPWLIFWWPIKM